MCADLAVSWEGKGGVGTVCPALLGGAGLPVAGLGPSDFQFWVGLKISLPYFTQDGMGLT